MSYTSEVLADSPIWYLRLQETSGSNANDQGSSNQDGTYVGGTQNQSGPYTGAVSVDMDGTDYVESVNSFDFSLTDPDTFTVEAWVWFDNLGQRNNIISFSNDNTTGMFWLEAGTGNGTQCVTAAKNAVFMASTANFAVTTGSWYHIVYKRTGAGIDTHYFYINGVESAITGSPSSFSNGSRKKLIGARTTVSQRLDGKIAEVAVYNSALSQARIQAHYNAATTNSYTTTHVVDSLIKASLSKSSSIDATIKTTPTTTYSTDATLTDGQTIAHAVDARLMLPPVTVSYSIDSALSGRVSLLHNIDSALSQRRVVSYVVDSTAVSRGDKTHAIDVLLGSGLTTKFVTPQIENEQLITPQIPDSIAWWNKRYPFRRAVKVIAPPGGLKAGHPVRVKIDLSTLEKQEKIRKDRADYRVISFDKRPVPSSIINESYISFPLHRGLNADAVDVYCIYYGSREKFATASFSEPRWPVKHNSSSSNISYYFPENVIDAATPYIKHGQAVVTAHADSVKISLATGPDGGLAQVGDKVVDLYSEVTSQISVVFEGLNPYSVTRINIISLASKYAGSSDFIIKVLGVETRSLPLIDEYFGEEFVLGHRGTIVDGV